MGLTIDEYLAGLPAPMLSGDPPRTTGGATEICKRIRIDLAGAVAAGIFPAGVTFSVRKTDYKSVRVEISAWPGNPLSPAYTDHLMECDAARMKGEREPEWNNRDHDQVRLRDDHHGRLSDPSYTPEVNQALANASRIGNRHNHDYSDSMTDHFDVGYYFDVNHHNLRAMATRGIRLESDPQYADLVRRAVDAAKTLGQNVIKSECGRLPVESCGDWTLTRLIEIAKRANGRPMVYDKRRRTWVVATDATPDQRVTISIPGYRPRRVESLAIAQRLYVNTRDRSGKGASDFGDGIVTTATGKTLRISYNGRVWDGAAVIQEAA